MSDNCELIIYESTKTTGELLCYLGEDTDDNFEHINSNLILILGNQSWLLLHPNIKIRKVYLRLLYYLYKKLSIVDFMAYILPVLKM